MTLQEFKAWFEGFSEGVEGRPTQKQWEKITARVEQINGVAQVPYPVYINQYPPPLWPYGARYMSGGGAVRSTTAAGIFMNARSSETASAQALWGDVGKLEAA